MTTSIRDRDGRWLLPVYIRCGKSGTVKTVANWRKRAETIKRLEKA